jgi:hypothetical protein
VILIIAFFAAAGAVCALPASTKYASEQLA